MSLRPRCTISGPSLHRRVCRALTAVLLGGLLGCVSDPDLGEWGRDPSFDLAVGELDATLADVDALRDGFDLRPARQLALALVHRYPDEPRAQLAASRAESDFVVLRPTPPEEQREWALSSALYWAEQAAAALPTDATAQGQLAWCLGATTHLVGMFSRADHAAETLEVCERALTFDPDQVLALRTKSTLRLRLATLPWIARMMAFGAPDGDLDEAIELAGRCVELQPSVENRLLLAKALLAAERGAEARQVLNTAMESGDHFPRDPALREDVAALLEELRDD